MKLKPLVEAKAREREHAGFNQHSPRPKSDEASAPIRTDAELAKLAGVGKDTIRKVERIAEDALPEVAEADPVTPRNASAGHVTPAGESWPVVVTHDRR